MKKTLTILMALLMLCSMVMCVSAAEYEGKGFTIDVPDTYTFHIGGSSDDEYEYYIEAIDKNVYSEMVIYVTKHDGTKAMFEEIASEKEIIKIDSRPASIEHDDEFSYCVINTYTDNYCIGIECEGDVEGAKAAFEIVKTMKFTDVSADDADNQDDTTTIGAIEEKTPNTTVLIAVIAVAAVLIVAGVVIIVVFTKKKKNN
jgi:hypothetical protein